MSGLFGGSRSLQENLILISGNTCERKLEKLHERGCTDAELEQCISGMKAFAERSQKDNLDRYKAEVGEEYFKLLLQNPKFDEMLRGFLQKEFEQLMHKAFKDIIELCNKYQFSSDDMPTMDEFKCMLHMHMKG